MTHTRSKHCNKCYAYYSALKGVKQGVRNSPCKIGSVPTGELDTFVLDKIQKIFKSPEVIKELAKQLEQENPKYSAETAFKLVNDIGEVFQYF